MSDRSKIMAVVGLGRMGQQMAARLAANGFSLRLWNRTPGRADGLPGATSCASPQEAAAGASIVLTSLADDTAVREVVLDPEGEDPPDLLDEDRIDLADYVVEHLALDIDPFPRKPGVTWRISTSRLASCSTRPAIRPLLVAPGSGPSKSSKDSPAITPMYATSSAIWLETS